MVLIGLDLFLLTSAVAWFANVPSVPSELHGVQTAEDVLEGVSKLISLQRSLPIELKRRLNVSGNGSLFLVALLSSLALPAVQYHWHTILLMRCLWKSLTQRSLLNIGKLVWEVVKDNKPSADVDSDYYTATPQGIEDWRSLTGWDSQSWDGWSASWSNPFGIEWSFTWQSNGNCQGCNAQHAADITEVVHIASAVWAFSVNMGHTSGQCLNKGSSGYQLSLLPLKVSVGCSSPMFDDYAERAVGVWGDGIGTSDAMEVLVRGLATVGPILSLVR